MPIRRTGSRTRKKSTVDLVNSYGFSINAIRVMEDMTPYTHPLSKVVDGWAKFLLDAESREEQRWMTMGIPILEEHLEQKVKLWKPKAISYVLPAGRYSPDFLYIFEDGLRLNVEVKGSPFQKGYKDARAKMRAAATLYWFDSFMMVMPKAGAEWTLEAIEPDLDYQTELQTLAHEVARINSEKDNDNE